MRIPALAATASVLLLAACSPAAASPSQGPSLSAPTPAAPASDSAPAATAGPSASVSPANLSRLPLLADEQGSIIVEVAPLDLAAGASEIKFEVSLNTHAVDLVFDLAQLSTLTTDTGISVPASLWDAPRGGHHVAGTLVFPSVFDGRPILEGANTLAVTIVDVDAAVRTFEWQFD